MGRWERSQQRQKKAEKRLVLRGLYSLAGLHDKIPQGGWFKEQKCISSQFWRLEDQGVEGFHSEGSPWLADAYLLSLSSPALFSARPHVCVLISPLIRTPVILDWNPAK